MKMLFFSSDVSEVRQVSNEFTLAGIPCEIRSTPITRAESIHAASSELWIRNDRDCHRALMLCVQLGMGFSRRPHHKDLLDDVMEPSESATVEME